MNLLSLLQFIYKTQWIRVYSLNDTLIGAGDRVMLLKDLKYEELLYPIHKIFCLEDNELTIYVDL